MGLSILLGLLTALLPASVLVAPQQAGALSNGPQCAQDGSCGPSSTRKVIYVDGSRYTITSAIGAANQSGNTIVLIPSGQTITRGMALTGANIDLLCLNRSTLTAGSGGFWMLSISGTNDAVRDCAFSPGGFSKSMAIFLKDAVHPEIEGVTISGFQSGNGLIYLMRAKNPVMRYNHLTTGQDGPDGIFGEMNTIDADVEGNIVDETLGNPGAHAIAFHSTTPGQTVRGAKIESNTILAGMNFCVEVGPFGGLTPSDVAVNQNSCELAKNGGSGGYSLSVENSTEAHNMFDAKGFTATIAAYEIVSSNKLKAEGNTAVIGQAWTRVITSAVMINQSRSISFTGNFIRGWGGGNALGSGGFGIAVVSASVNDAVVDDNVISGNILIFPAGQAVGGVFQQCDAKGAKCSGNTYADNVLVGSGSQNSLAFRLEDDAGTTASTTIADNILENLEYGIFIWDPGVAGTSICHNTNHATAEVVDHGTRTMIAAEACNSGLQ